MAVTIDKLITGPLATNSYVLRSGTDCWVVDPGAPGGQLPGRAT